jgi:AcrR family transcriptional regulator
MIAPRTTTDAMSISPRSSPAPSEAGWAAADEAGELDIGKQASTNRREFLRFDAKLVTLMAVERPLRRDAERNRARLLDAARALFAERGLDVSMDQIAERAGVGVGTAYRRFESREAIIEALFEDRMEQIVTLAEEALESDAPGLALGAFLERLVAMQAADRGLKELFMRDVERYHRIAERRECIRPIVERLVRRAVDAGEVRPELTDGDMAVASMMLGAVVELSTEVEPDLWRRYLTILLDGMRTGESPLPVPALDHEQLLRAMASRHGRRR